MIVKSTIAEDARQIDGRRFIREVHTDDAGVEHHVTYLGESKADPNEMLPIRSAQIDEQIAEKQADEQASAAFEKDQAVELLKLGDESIAKILMVSSESVASEKEKLEGRASKIAEREAVK